MQSGGVRELASAANDGLRGSSIVWQMPPLSSSAYLRCGTNAVQAHTSHANLPDLPLSSFCDTTQLSTRGLSLPSSMDSAAEQPTRTIEPTHKPKPMTLMLFLEGFLECGAGVQRQTTRVLCFVDTGAQVFFF